MRGGLRLTHVKRYRKEDKTRDGISKEGWRLVLLQGCPTFMEELRKFDQDHRFPVGAGHVIVRGGSGRPKGTVSRGRRGNEEPEQARKQKPGSKDRDGNRSYDQAYPPLNRDKDRDRTRERTRGGHGGARGHLSASGMAWGSAGPRRGPK